MTLPAELEKRVQEFVRQIEEQSEWPLTSLERLALEEGYTDGYGKGLQQGLQQGERKGQIRFTMRVLKSRFGDAALPLEEKLVQVPSLETLEELAITAIEATSLEEFTRALEAALTTAPETAETE
jgi:flagellar biosynthesis/type III secretory pathway protein FliH